MENKKIESKLKINLKKNESEIGQDTDYEKNEWSSIGILRVAEEEEPPRSTIYV